MLNIYSRRSFLEKFAMSGAALGLASLANIPPFLRRALAEGTIGQGANPKKLLFIFLRGAQDGLNSVIPVLDDSYSEQRSSIYQPRVGQTSETDNSTGDPYYNSTSVGDYGTSSPDGYTLNHMLDCTVWNNADQTTARTATDPTFSFVNIIPSGNGFAGFHPSCKFLAPAFNAGDLAVVHRVAFPNQTRSHFDDQPVYENGRPGQAALKEGIFYRTMEEAILADPTGVGQRALTGVSFQSSLPVLLKGSQFGMTNITDPARFALLGTGSSANTETSTRIMHTNTAVLATQYRYATKSENRDALEKQYASLSGTLRTFAEIDFTDAGANDYFDPTVTDGDTVHNASTGYNLFPVSNATNGGYTAHGNEPDKYVIPTNQYAFMRNLKAAALVLGNTDALIAGSEFGSWDTHNVQVSTVTNPDSGNPTTLGRHTGDHANLMRTMSWSIFALKKFFSNPTWSPKCSWNDVVIVTVTEFGRTSAQNTNLGTDHANAGLMFVAGGGVKGKVYACNTSGETYNGNSANWSVGTGGQNGVMYGHQSRYLQRAVDYRCIFGNIIRNHMGAADTSASSQLGRIVPGYGLSSNNAGYDERANLLTGGASPRDGVSIVGELGII